MMDIAERIQQLKKEKNAVILAHYYARPEVQDVADYLGDSLGLSRKAAATDASLIVFCGVHFMAETAALISPDKKVLSPAPDAGCSLADSVAAAGLRKWKSEHPDGLVVSYVNTTAEVKAWTDYCCTSANVVDVVRSLPEGHDILFGPDRNLGAYVGKVTGRKMELWDGACVVHEEITSVMVNAALDRYPDADILIHPESRCSSDVALLGNSRVRFCSTAGMLKHAASSDRKIFVIATEVDTLHQLKKNFPDRVFVPVSGSAVCTQMKKVTLESVLDCLENETDEVVLEPEMRARAAVPVMKMIGSL